MTRHENWYSNDIDAIKAIREDEVLMILKVANPNKKEGEPDMIERMRKCSYIECVIQLATQNAWFSIAE